MKNLKKFKRENLKSIQGSGGAIGLVGCVYQCCPPPGKVRCPKIYCPDVLCPEYA